MRPLVSLRGVGKVFTLHQRGSVSLPVLGNVNLDVFPGECLVLDGASGSGKSTLLRLIYGNYRATTGSIRFDLSATKTAELNARHADTDSVDLSCCAERQVTRLRRDMVAYVSQFLRTVPRVPALDVVAEPLLTDAGQDDDARQAARDAAATFLARLGVDRSLWSLPPATFSGGEQQRVNLARGLVKPRALLLLDEPTASLDAANRAIVVNLIREQRVRGIAVVGIFHDRQVSEAVATRRIDMSQFK